MNYHNITKDDMKNGDGLRVVLWVAGCGHHCPGCQNPVTHDPCDGILFDEAAKEELFDQLSKDYISGITLSGGDPLFPSNEGEILKLCREIREMFPKKTIWLYTGYTWDAIKEKELMHCLDVVVDGRFVWELLDLKLKWRGSSNQNVIDVKKSLKTGETVLWCD